MIERVTLKVTVYFDDDEVAEEWWTESVSATSARRTTAGRAWARADAIQASGRLAWDDCMVFAWGSAEGFRAARWRAAEQST